MAYKVLQSFRDVRTRVVYKPGNEYPNAPTERIEKLISLSFIAEVEEKSVEAVTKNNTVAEIKAFLDEKDIEYPAKATKSELLELLED